MQIWHAPSSSYILTPKTFGKSLAAEQLPSALSRFFPFPSDRLQHLSPSPSTSSQPQPPSILKPYIDHRLSLEQIDRLLQILDNELAALEAVLRDLEARFIGASVLVVYEGETDHLSESLTRWDAGNRERRQQAIVSTSLAADLEDEMDEDDDDDDESLDLDGTQSDEREASHAPPLVLRMIDFAHTRLTPGEGRDEGVLQGIATVRDLVHSRRDAVTSALQGQTPG